jgi:hypothetical protein
MHTEGGGGKRGALHVPPQKTLKNAKKNTKIEDTPTPPLDFLTIPCTPSKEFENENEKLPVPILALDRKFLKPKIPLLKLLI